MPKPTEIFAALADTSAVDSHESLQAEMVDLFTNLSDCMRDWNDARPAKIMRKMAATIKAVPYDMLAELGHSYNAALLSCMLILRVVHAIMPTSTIWCSRYWTSCEASISIILTRKRR